MLPNVDRFPSQSEWYFVCSFIDRSLRGLPMAEAKVKVMMQKPTRFPESATDELPREFIELGKKIAALPEEHYRELEHSYSQVVDCVRRRRRILNLVQEALSQLRLDVKYLMFDLEITRQERDLLRSQIDEGGGENFSSDWS